MKRGREDPEADPPAGDSAVEGAGAAAPSSSSSTLTALPNVEMYERSFMHRDHVTQIVCTASDFVVTGSRDGQLKFWKKMQRGVEFVKHFRAHLAPIACIAATPDGSLLATTAADKALKVFDVLSFDMINWIKLDFTPGACEWLSDQRGRSRTLLAIADVDASPMRLYDATGDGALVKTVSVHGAPVLQMKLNAAHDAMVSADARGVIEYWRSDGDSAAPRACGLPPPPPPLPPPPLLPPPLLVARGRVRGRVLCRALHRPVVERHATGRVDAHARPWRDAGSPPAPVLPRSRAPVARQLCDAYSHACASPLPCAQAG